MKNYADFYARVSHRFQKNAGLARLLIGLNTAITLLMYVAYPCLLMFLLWENSRAVLPVILVPLAGFLFLSIFRKWLNVPRPYEAWELFPIISKSEKGESFPSRHVFSATIISMCFLKVHLGLGILFLCLSLVLAVCRVLGGVHYPKDVLVAYGCGLACGGLLFML